VVSKKLPRILFFEAIKAIEVIEFDKVGVDTNKERCWKGHL
jgi:hypothetical protein